MSECLLCGRDHDFHEVVDYEEDGLPITVVGPACHCVYENNVRIAVGICCGHMLGEDLLLLEEESDSKRIVKT